MIEIMSGEDAVADEGLHLVPAISGPSVAWTVLQLWLAANLMPVNLKRAIDHV